MNNQEGTEMDDKDKNPPPPTVNEIFSRLARPQQTPSNKLQSLSPRDLVANHLREIYQIIDADSSGFSKIFVTAALRLVVKLIRMLTLESSVIHNQEKVITAYEAHMAALTDDQRGVLQEGSCLVDILDGTDKKRKPQELNEVPLRAARGSIVRALALRIITPP